MSHLSKPVSNNTYPSMVDAVEQWLHLLGFAFNPFATLDASEDPHLGQYLIQLDAFSQTWGAWSNFVFEAPGGGKTAMRLHTSNSCYVGQETNRPFPITYCPPFIAWDRPDPGLREHQNRILQSAAAQLLLTLAYRPRWFYRLHSGDQRRVVAFLQDNLDRPLREPLRLGHQPQGFRLLQSSLNAFLGTPDDIPTDAQVAEFCSALGALTPQAEAGGRKTVAQRWEALYDILLDVVQFDCIYLLLDGFDASPDTVNNPQHTIQALAPLIRELSGWQQRKLYVKGFLPDSIQGSLLNTFADLASDVDVIQIEWSRPLLVEMVRQRVLVASHGEFQSLDAIAAPGSALESQIVDAVPRLPREVLVLTQRLLWEHVHFSQPKVERLQPDDLQRAIIWYQEQAQ